MEQDDRTPAERRPAPEDSPAGRLSPADAIEVAGRVAEVVKTGLPLASGLRALGEEVPSRRLRRALARISGRLEAGDSLNEAIAQHGRSLPRHVRGLLQTGLDTGRLALLMEQYLNYARGSLDVQRRLWLALGYPLLLLAAMTVIVGGLMQCVVPKFKKIFADFGTELPSITILVINVSNLMIDFGLWFVVVPVVVAVACWHGLALFGGRAMRRRIVNSIPVAGSLFRYGSLSRFCHLLAILVEFDVRLPDALRMAGDGTGDANIREGCRLAADKIEQGDSLVDAASATPHFPADVRNLFRWENRKDAFHDALEGAAELFAVRARTQTGLIPVIVEPILIVAVAVSIGTIVIALFMPLIKLLNDLS